MLRIPSETPNTPSDMLRAKLAALEAYERNLEREISASEDKLIAQLDSVYECGKRAIAAHAANPNADAKAGGELDAYLAEAHRLNWRALNMHKNERAKLREFREAYTRTIPLLYAEARAAESKGGGND